MAQSSQYTYFRVTDFLGTVQDLSNVTTDVPALGTDADATDVTTFAAAGAQTAHSYIRGALKSEFTSTHLFTPTLIGILEPLVGNNTGFLVERATGTNATPTFGDEWIGGTYILFNMHPDASSTATGPMTVKCDWKLADGASVLPVRTKFGA